MVNIRGKSGKQFSVTVFIFWGSKITADGDCSHEIKSDLLFGRKVMTNLQFMKRQGCNFADKCPYSQSYGFSSSHVRTWEFDHKEGWALKNSCFPTVVLEKTLESPFECKEIKPVNPQGKEINPEYLLERLMLKLQSFGHLMWRAKSLENTLMLGKMESKSWQK